uniref:Titin n=1 Tax=Astyanax mexicanus TaxID=7994 RepID=A0A8B9LS27_ASTMX
MTYRIDQLEEGRNYFFRVVAENEHGIGLPAETPEPLKISEKPQPPGKISVVDVTRKSVSLSWEKPEHDGGSRISHYEVEMQAKDSEKWSLCASVKALDTIVTNLAQGEEYNFRVIAVNDKGKSDPRLLAHPVVAKDLVIDTSVRTKLSTYSVQVGYDLKIEARITGHPKPTITWTKDEKRDLPDGRWMKASFANVLDTEFTVTGLTEDSKYDFRIIARNGAGSVSKPSQCTGSITAKDEIQPPTYEVDSKYSQIITVSAGETFTLEASVLGKPVPTIQWFKGDVEVENSARAEIKNTDFTAVLVVKDAIRVDEYKVQICALNRLGVGEPIALTGTVKPVDKMDPPEIELDAELRKGIVVRAGGSMRINIPFKGRPTPEINWTKDDGDLPSKAQIEKGLNYTQLSIDICDRNDAGKYTLNLENSSGISAFNEKGRSDPRPLAAPVTAKDITIEPSFKITCNTFSVQCGEDLKVEIPVKGRPAPKVTWTKDGQALKETTRLNVSSTATATILSIKDANREDCGKYTITAANTVGTVSEEIGIIILDKPGPPVGPVKIEEVSADFVVISWEPPVYTGGCQINNYIVEKRDTTTTAWQIVSATIARTTIKISKLKTGSEYQFRVSAENRYGKSTVDDLQQGGVYHFRVLAVNELGVGLPVSTTEPVKVSQAPLPPGKVTLVDVTRHSVSLSWEKPDHDGGSKITAYVIEMLTKGTDKWTVCATVKALEATIEGLTTGEEYSFRITAVNDKGKSDPKPLLAPVVAKDITIEPIIDLLFSTYSVKAGDDLKIDVPFRGRPHPEVVWKKDAHSLKQTTRTPENMKSH